MHKKYLKQEKVPEKKLKKSKQEVAESVSDARSKANTEIEKINIDVVETRQRANEEIQKAKLKSAEEVANAREKAAIEIKAVKEKLELAKLEYFLTR